MTVRSFTALWKRFLKWQARTREPGLTALLFIEGALIFIVIPVAGMGLLPEWTVPAAFVVFVLATLVVTSRSHTAALIVAIAVLLSPAGAFVHAEHPSILTECVSAAARLLAITALIGVIAIAVFGPGRVTWHRVQGAVVLYLTCALLFYTVFRLLDLVLPGAFSGLPTSGAEHGSGAAMLYFSFSTLTTLGFGDIAPVHPLVRDLANLEAVIGQLYPATLLARLVTLGLEHRRSKND